MTDIKYNDETRCIYPPKDKKVCKNCLYYLKRANSGLSDSCDYMGVNGKSRLLISINNGGDTRPIVVSVMKKGGSGMIKVFMSLDDFKEVLDKGEFMIEAKGYDPIVVAPVTKQKKQKKNNDISRNCHFCKNLYKRWKCDKCSDYSKWEEAE